MKKLLIILSLTFGLTTAAQAKILWECTATVDKNNAYKVIRFKDTVVEMWNGGEIYTYFCNTDKNLSDIVTKEICVSKDDEFLNLMIFDERNGVPSSYSYTYLDTSENGYKEVEPVFPQKLEDCKEY